jgi:hypothetical protein
MEEEMDEETEEDSIYQKQMDSLKIEKFKITKKLAEKDFDDYFNSAGT